MKDLIGKAHAYLDDKGCKSMGQQYTAFEVERMLADFAQQQLNLLTISDVMVSGCDCKAPTYRDYYRNHRCTKCNALKNSD